MGEALRGFLPPNATAMEKLTLENTKVVTGRLTSLPESEAEREARAKYQAKDRQEGKKVVTVCCKNVVAILRRALQIGLSREEFEVFRGAFQNHRLCDFFSRTNYRRKPLEVSALVNEAFQLAGLFEGEELREHFLSSVAQDVEARNKNPMWAADLLRFRRLFRERREGKPAREAGQEQPAHGETRALVLYYYYRHQIGHYPDLSIIVSRRKTAALNELAKKHGRSESNFRKVFNAIGHNNDKDPLRNTANIREAIRLLEDCPEAQKLALNDLKMWESKKVTPKSDPGP